MNQCHKVSYLIITNEGNSIKMIDIVKSNICHIFLKILDVNCCNVQVWSMSQPGDGHSSNLREHVSHNYN